MMERSSSNDLSSVPNSDTEGHNSAHNISSTIVVSRDGHMNHFSPSIMTSKHNGGTIATIPDSRQEAAPKQRKPRKKKDSDAATTPADKKEKGTRKPRGASLATGSTRKKAKTEADSSTDSAYRQSHVTEPIPSRPTHQTVIDLTLPTTSTSSEIAKVSRNGFTNSSTPVSPPQGIAAQYSPAPTPQLSIPRAMAYDPVRSLTVPRKSEPVTYQPLPQPNNTTSPRPLYNPSTSPAISSIINPPDISTAKREPVTTVDRLRPEDTTPSPTVLSRPRNEPVVMDLDPPVVKAESTKVDLGTKNTTPEAVAVKVPSKPRAKEQPPPLPTGSGLLSSSLFGGDSGLDSHKSSNDRGTSIVLHIDLKDPNNKVINFARMAEEKYGFATLYPRQAAQKERLARVAAAGAALERAGVGLKGAPATESGDEEISVDIERDSDNDGDVMMSGMNGTGDAVNSGTDGPVPKRRKRKDEYDADDPFVDDSELLWEAQAAASKDGFFVYCGPLVPEGEKPAVERADGTVKRGRGRGRGGGPGSRGGRGGAANIARDTEGSGGRGGGPGSRGGGITRKPRITKAERQQRELEKKQREQMAVIAAKPPNYQT